MQRVTYYHISGFDRSNKLEFSDKEMEIFLQKKVTKWNRFIRVQPKIAWDFLISDGCIKFLE